MARFLFPASIKLPRTQSELVWHQRFPTAIVCAVSPEVCCQVGSSSSQSTSGSMEQEQLPWQHQRSSRACGTLTYDIGTISDHTRLQHSFCQLPLTSSRAFTHHQDSPRNAFQDFETSFTTSPRQTCQTRLHPLSSSAPCTHTELPTLPH